MIYLNSYNLFENTIFFTEKQARKIITPTFSKKYSIGTLKKLLTLHIFWMFKKCTVVHATSWAKLVVVDMRGGLRVCFVTPPFSSIKLPEGGKNLGPYDNWHCNPDIKFRLPHFARSYYNTGLCCSTIITVGCMYYSKRPLFKFWCPQKQSFPSVCPMLQCWQQAT